MGKHPHPTFVTFIFTRNPKAPQVLSRSLLHRCCTSPAVRPHSPLVSLVAAEEISANSFLPALFSGAPTSNQESGQLCFPSFPAIFPATFLLSGERRITSLFPVDRFFPSIVSSVGEAKTAHREPHFFPQFPARSSPLLFLRAAVVLRLHFFGFRRLATRARLLAVEDNNPP